MVGFTDGDWSSTEKVDESGGLGEFCSQLSNVMRETAETANGEDIGRLEIESQDFHNASIVYFWADLPKTHKKTLKIGLPSPPTIIWCGLLVENRIQAKRPPPHAPKSTAQRGTSMPLHSWRSGNG